MSLDAWPRVLIVEDEEESGLLLAAMIHAAYPKAEVRTACDGLRAADEAARLKPDLVISDVVMPLRSGHDLCRWLRSDPELARTPVLLLSAYHTAKSERDAYEAGADAYCPKPFRTDELRRRCEGLLGEAPR